MACHIDDRNRNGGSMDGDYVYSLVTPARSLQMRCEATRVRSVGDTSSRDAKSG